MLVPVLVPAARGARPPWWRTLAGLAAVALPVMQWVAVGWARHDVATAREVDARLDAAADDRTPWWER